MVNTNFRTAIAISDSYVVPESIYIFKEGGTAYCSFELREEAIRSLAIVKIFEAIYRHWLHVPLFLQLDPVSTGNYIGVIIQRVDGYSL